MISQELQAVLEKSGNNPERVIGPFQANNFQIIALTFLPLSKGQQR